MTHVTNLLDHLNGYAHTGARSPLALPGLQNEELAALHGELDVLFGYVYIRVVMMITMMWCWGLIVIVMVMVKVVILMMMMMMSMEK
jgi:hypothetical protein